MKLLTTLAVAALLAGCQSTSTLAPEASRVLRENVESVTVSPAGGTIHFREPDPKTVKPLAEARLTNDQICHRAFLEMYGAGITRPRE